MDKNNKCYICLFEVEKSDILKVCKKNGCKYYIHKECYMDKKKYGKEKNIILYDCDICRTFSVEDESIEMRKRLHDFVNENILAVINNPGLIGIFIIVYSVYVFLIIILISKNM